jgi:hypothetical protein
MFAAAAQSANIIGIRTFERWREVLRGGEVIRRSSSFTFEPIYDSSWGFGLQVESDAWVNLGGFRGGVRHADFTTNQKTILQQSYDRINQDDCKNWINEKLKQNGAPKGRDTLDALLKLARLSRYNSKYSATDMGISEAEWKEINDNYDVKSSFGEYAVARAITSDKPRYRIYLMDEIFNQGIYMIQKKADTAGILVHELFHLAGFNDPFVKSLNKEIRAHCRTIGSEPF